MKNKALTLISVVLGFVARAQNCPAALDEAERLYFNGRFERVIEKLAPCDVGLSPNQSERHFSLLAQAHLISGNDSAARAWTEDLLHRPPLFTPKYGAIEGFKDLIEEYKLVPRWSWCLSAGAFDPEMIIDRYHTFSSKQQLPESYQGQLGFQANAAGAFYPLPWIVAEGSIGVQAFEYGYTDVILDAQAARFDDRLKYLNFSLAAGLSVPVSGWKLELLGGVLARSLLKATADASLIPTVEDIPTQGNPYPAEIRGVDSKKWRSPWNHSALMQMRIQKDIGVGAIGLAAGFQYGLSNLTDSELRWIDPDFTYAYGYLADDFRLIGWNVQVTYSRFIYTPKRK